MRADGTGRGERSGSDTVLGYRLDDTHDPRRVTTLRAPDRRLRAAVQLQYAMRDRLVQLG